MSYFINSFSIYKISFMLTLSIIKPVYYLVEPMVGLDTELLN